MKFIDFHTHLHIRLDDADERRLRPCRADPLLPLLRRVVWGAFERFRYRYLIRRNSVFERPMERALARIMRSDMNDSTTGEEALENRMHKAGVERAVVLAVPPVSRNEDVFAAARRNTRFIPFFSPDCRNSEPVESQLEAARAAGARGYKLHPILQNLSLGGETVRATAASAQQHGFALVIHAGGSRALFNQCNGVRPDAGEFARLANAFPGLRLVVAHAGLWEWREYLSAAALAENLYLDISFQSPEVMRAAIDVAGPRRILFGSDFPMGSPSIVRDNLESLGLPGDDLELIGRGNALRLLGEAASG